MVKSNIVENNNCIIATNPKCGWSSLVNLKNNKYINLQYNFDNKKIFLIYRNIITRNISLFLSWIYKQDKNNIINYIIAKIRHNKELLNNFKLYKKNKNIIELYKIFIDVLPKILHKNSHINYQNIKLNKILNLVKDKSNITFIDIEKDLTILEKEIDQKFPHKYKSEDKNKIILNNFLNNNKDYKNKLLEIYQKDILYFKKYDIIV